MMIRRFLDKVSKNIIKKMINSFNSVKYYISEIEKNQNKSIFRIKFIAFFFIIFFLVIQFKIIHTIVFDGEQVIRKVKETQKKRIDIIDRNGMVLATDIGSFDLYLRADQVDDIDQTIQKISNIIFLTSRKKEIIKINLEKYRGVNKLVLIAHNILSNELMQTLKDGIIGIYYEENIKRAYLQNNLTSHIVGFVSEDRDGLSGIESYFDTYLKSSDLTDEPLELSIDINIQGLLRNIISNAVEKHNAIGGVGLISKIDTGEIIAAVSYPDFNPNNISKVNNDKLFNRFSLGVYELGSIIKIITTVYALENGISDKKIYNIPRELKIGKYTIKDFSTVIRPKMNMYDIMKYSSNMGMMLMVSEIDKYKEHYKFLEEINFFKQSTIEIPERAKVNIISDKVWNKSISMSASYGYGIRATPLHFMECANALINDGKYIPLTILKKYSKPEVEQINLKRNSSIILRKILKDVVEGGFGSKSAAEKYSVGGKSGTVMKLVNGSYSKFHNIVSFYAAVPIEKPEYSFLIVIDDPKDKNIRNVVGGAISAPLVSEIISTTGPVLGIDFIKN